MAASAAARADPVPLRGRVIGMMNRGQGGQMISGGALGKAKYALSLGRPDEEIGRAHV